MKKILLFPFDITHLGPSVRVPGLLVCLLSIQVLAGCGLRSDSDDGMTETTKETSSTKTAEVVVTPVPATPTPDYNEQDLVPLADVVPGIVVDLALAGTDQPFGMKTYREKNRAWLRYGTALKLREVQKRLAAKGLGLKIWDSYRPFIVQVALFEAAGGNGNWVSDPYRKTGKKTHVRGVAVDCTIIDSNGNELSMPTPYLDFEHGAERMKHSFTDLPKDVLEHRALLKSVMVDCGMEPYSGEWWHYQDADWERYPIIESEEFPEVHKQLLTDELWKRIRP